MAPTFSDPLCQEQLVESAKEVAKSVEGCVFTCKDVCVDDAALRELGGSAGDVTRALNELLNHVKDGHSDKIPDIMEQIMTASGELIASYDSSEMVKQARILAQSTAELIQAIKGEAETQSDSELQVSNGDGGLAGFSGRSQGRIVRKGSHPPFWTEETLHNLASFAQNFNAADLIDLDWQYPPSSPLTLAAMHRCNDFSAADGNFVTQGVDGHFYGSRRNSVYENAYFYGTN